jgi:glutaredoxin 3
MKKIIMYTSNYCSFCSRAESLLINKGAKEIKKIKVDEDPDLLLDMIKKTGNKTVPQIYIGEHYIGGFNELRDADLSGDLDKYMSG